MGKCSADESLASFKKLINKMIGMGMLDEALEGVNRVIKSHPGDAELYAFISTIRMMKGEFEEADHLAQIGLKIDPLQGDLLFNRGKAAVHEGKYTQAYRFFSRMLMSCNGNEMEPVKQIMKDLAKEKHVDEQLLSMPKGKRRVLIVAYYFPPLAGSGVQRTLKLVKYLRMTGWEPVVVTTDAVNFLTDQTLTDELPEDIRVIRIKNPKTVSGEFIMRMCSRLAALLTPEMAQVLKAHFAGAPKEAKSYMIPDIGSFWAMAVIDEIERYIGRDSVDLIYSTSGPYSDHIIGYYLKKMFGKPWVADFRDEWSYNPSVVLDRSGIAFKLNNSLERSVVEYADRIITVSDIMTANYQEHFGLPRSKLKTITNGYDEEDFEGLDLSETSSDKFTIMHNGLIYMDRTPDSVITAIKNLIDKGMIPKDRIRLRLGFADSRSELEEKCRSLGLESVVEFFDYMTHRKSLRTAAGANVLLLLLGVGKGNEVAFTGKIFEYLRLCKPIISLGPKDSIAGRLIEETHRGKHIFIEDVQKAEKYIYLLYNEWEKGTLPKFEPNEAIERFERKNTTKAFSSVFNELFEHAAGTKKSASGSTVCIPAEFPDEIRNMLSE